jgi:carboxyl-terminal processing protease
MLKDSPQARNRRLLFRIIYISLIILLQFLIVGIAFAGGYLFNELRYGPQETYRAGPGFTLAKSPFPLLNEAYNILKDNGYFDLPATPKLEYGMIRGMLDAYNEPFTVFVEPPQAELQTNQLEGRFGGIGVRVERDAENYIYFYPLPDSPAQKAGILDGDRLLAVEDMPITPQTSSDEVQAAIRGPISQKVTITIGRKPDYSPQKFTIERGEVALPSVTWNLAAGEPRVGIVHIQVIADTTPAEVTKAIQDLQTQGATYFVIDARNNGGGLVEAGVNTARLFLKSGVVMEQQYRNQPVKTYAVEKPGQFADLPMVVLINRGTASAAEIFSGAIKGQHRAQIVGSRSYGKDTIQLVYSLSDGSSLHVTAAHWWIPGLEPKIGQNGVQPDVAIDENADDNQAQQKAIETVLSLR